VHIGGIVDPLFLFKNPSVALRVNLEGTVNVLECARLVGVERVVYFSSIGVLLAVQYQPIDGAHPIILPKAGPASGAYGAAKISGEAFCFAFRLPLFLRSQTRRGIEIAMTHNMVSMTEATEIQIHWR
jgi:nucleoside-diphosphate-sugar epimerase